MSEVNLDQKQVIKEAEAQGMKVIRGTSKTLLLDLDGDAVRDYQELLDGLVKNGLAPWIAITDEKRWRSKNGNMHVKLTLDQPLGVITRLLIQACLGSDRKKEFLSLLRVWSGIKEPSLLFKPPNVYSKKKETFSPVDTASERRARYNSIDDDDVPF